MKNRLLALLLVIGLPLVGCFGSGAEPEADSGATETAAIGASSDAGDLSIPTIEAGLYNAAWVYIGPHDDGGWTQAHDVGRQYVADNVAGVHTAYVELVPEGAAAEQVIRALAREGFDVIFTTSFGYMNPSEAVASEFRDVDIIHISGYKSNGANFGNLYGAMETMKYLNGMIAGSRAMVDGNLKLGYMPTFPVPEELRLGNAFALGAAVTCPDCTIEIRWIGTWHDPVVEQEAAKSLFDAGAQVVMNGADTSAAVQVAPVGKWGITYNYIGSCTSDQCLTAGYWNWGVVYADVVQRSMAGDYVGGSEYFDADSGALGLWGFMAGQEPMPGIADLPAQDVQLVRETLAAALTGEFDRFDVFKGPIIDNRGDVIVEAGESLGQIDLDGFAQFGSPCAICMYWWNGNFIAQLPDLN